MRLSQEEIAGGSQEALYVAEDILVLTARMSELERVEVPKLESVDAQLLVVVAATSACPESA